MNCSTCEKEIFSDNLSHIHICYVHLNECHNFCCFLCLSNFVIANTQRALEFWEPTLLHWIPVLENFRKEIEKAHLSRATKGKDK